MRREDQLGSAFAAELTKSQEGLLLPVVELGRRNPNPPPRIVLSAPWPLWTMPSNELATHKLQRQSIFEKCRLNVIRPDLTQLQYLSL
jgi:hypothetical protein